MADTKYKSLDCSRLLITTFDTKQPRQVFEYTKTTMKLFVDLLIFSDHNVSSCRLPDPVGLCHRLPPEGDLSQGGLPVCQHRLPVLAPHFPGPVWNHPGQLIQMKYIVDKPLTLLHNES